jgi:GNAT superfamily N-acetyltransferase
VGFVVGYLAPDDPRLAVCQAIGVHPSHRRHGIGRALLERFMADARRSGAQRLESVSWPGDRRSVRFHLALGFRPDAGPETRPVFGLPAVEGYDFGTEDRVRFVREL